MKRGEHVNIQSIGRIRTVQLQTRDGTLEVQQGGTVADQRFRWILNHGSNGSLMSLDEKGERVQSLVIVDEYDFLPGHPQAVFLELQDVMIARRPQRFA